MKFPNARIVQLAKEPLEGHVKTRLISDIGSSAACELHKKLVRYTWQNLSAANVAPMALWVDSAHLVPFFDTLIPAVSDLNVQQGEGLGQRMSHAAETVLKRSEAVIIIGSDCPLLDESYITSAFESLYKGPDVVIGPASDGGYVLMGMRRHIPQVFDDIEWGSHTVLSETRERLRAIDCDWHELTTLWDVDRSEDLQRLRSLEGFSGF